jgi:hypothetical protein
MKKAFLKMEQTSQSPEVSGSFEVTRVPAYWWGVGAGSRNETGNKKLPQAPFRCCGSKTLLITL